FWLGACVERSPQVAKEVYSRGHWIGLHGYSHHNFPQLSPSELKQSLEKTQAVIYNSCNLPPEKVRDIRPPNGLFTPQTLQLFRQWDYRPVMWSVVPEDWVRPGISKVVERVMKDLHNGSLIVLHDGYYGGQDVAETAQIIIPKLLEQGYSFVNIDTLWKSVNN
ncbi:MAG: polysaccharide deacetylase family protein, partial [Cyanobacteria bacterium J06636_27]